MKDRPHTDISTLLEEIYLLDPTLRDQADLPNLITTLHAHRPEVVINQNFVHTLRASLLAAAGNRGTASAGAIPSPFFWWVTRLTPVAVALVLFVILLPHPATAPILEHSPAPTLEMPSEATDEYNAFPRQKSMNDDDTTRSMSDDTSVMMMESVPSALTIEPPMVGETLTVTSVTLPVDGWLVVYGDDAMTKVMGTTLLVAGEHQEVVVPLKEVLQYPQMITVVVYTATVREQFVSTSESIQNDPFTQSPMMLTVPVISELELETEE